MYIFITMIACKSCGKEVLQSPRKGGRAKLYCDESCRNRWRYENDPSVLNRNTYTEQKARGYSNKWKALQYKGGKCQTCGEDRPATLCFHHRDPSQKELKLDGRSFANRKWETINEGIDIFDLHRQNSHLTLN